MKTRKSFRQDARRQQAIDEVISKFSQHLMSNSKWVRLIARLVENIDKIKKIKMKKVQLDEIGELYLDANTTFGFDYWENGFEECNSFEAVSPFKEIEFLAFPKVVDVSTKTEQDLDQIAEVIRKAGHFLLKVSDQELKLICYRR